MQDLDNHQNKPPKVANSPHFMADAGEDASVKKPPASGAVLPDTTSLPGLSDKDKLLSSEFSGQSKDRHAPLLKTMLLVTFIVVLGMVPLIAVLGLLTFGDGIGVLLVMVGLLLAYGALRLGYVLACGYIFIVGALVSFMVRSTLNNDGPTSELTFNYFTVAVVVMLAGLVIHEIAPFVVVGLGFVGYGFIFWQHSLQYPMQAALLTQLFFMITGINVLMAFMGWINARSILRALDRMTWQNERLLQFNRHLEKNISLTSTVGDSIGQLASELLDISYEQSDRAQSQAQSVVIVTSTLEELSATARQVAEVADNVYSATEQALHTAETGGKAVGFGIDSIATLTDQIETISTIANELGRQSRRISEIVETITELAEETNLLALNATIEAAGAGEYGRRFAVVAQEVQFLATRSRAASRDVQNILGQIRSSINNTLKATDEGLTEAQRMSEVASQAGEALEQIIENVEGTTYLARQINLTTQQQRTATDQAVEMIRQVAGNSRESTARSKQLLLASDRLNQTAATLRLSPPEATPAKAET